MIYTDHQYRVTTDAANKFRMAIEEMKKFPKAKSSDKNLHQLQLKGLKLKLGDLENELAEYDKITSTDSKSEISSLQEIGIGLVKARIKIGIDQETLAKRLNMNVKEIISHEDEFYSAISVVDIRNIAEILKVKIPNRVLPSNFDGKINKILTKLKKVGLEREFVLSRLIPPFKYSGTIEKSQFNLDKYTLKLCIYLKHVFGWTLSELISSKPLKIPKASSESAKFKVQSNRNPERVNVYSVYVNYLAKLAANAAEKLDKKVIPTDPIEIRNAIINSYGSINLQNVINFAWDCGAVILPLNDKGNSFGVCTRINGRNVIILNPREKSISFWLFDLLHELSHASQEPENDSFIEITSEVTSHERRMSQEEIDANKFAIKVILGGKEEYLFKQCTKRAKNEVRFLKRVIPEIAEKYNVMVGALAYYVAYRLGTEFPGLWAVARNLQPKDENPFVVTRDIFIKRLPFHIENQIDKELLLQSLEEE